MGDEAQREFHRAMMDAPVAAIQRGSMSDDERGGVDACQAEIK
jgi:hypothetical protein